MEIDYDKDACLKTKAPGVQANLTKIMLVDDHPIVRQGMKMIIDREDDFFVCAEAGNANEAIDKINCEGPDVVIVDITLSGSVSGIDLVKSIKDRFPNIYTLVLSMHDENIFAERSIRSGARGYLMKEVAPRNIIDAIRKILSGGIYLNEKTSEKLIHKLVQGTNAAPHSSIDILTDRELEVFQLMGNGFSIKEIAKKLSLSVYTVETHKRNIKEKFKLKDSGEVLRHAIQWVIARTQ